MKNTLNLSPYKNFNFFLLVIIKLILVKLKLIVTDTDFVTLVQPYFFNSDNIGRT